MADYCDLVLNVSLREDTPKDVIEFLQKCFDEECGYSFATSFSDEDERQWCWILQSRGLCFSGGDARILIEDEYRKGEFVITLRIRPLNYLSEVKKFLNYISPWIREDLSDTSRDCHYFLCGYLKDCENKFPVLIHYDMIDKQFIFFELNSISKKTLQDDGLWSE